LHSDTRKSIRRRFAEHRFPCVRHPRESGDPGVARLALRRLAPGCPRSRAWRESWDDAYRFRNKGL